MARLKKASTPEIGETYMINKKGWLKVSYVAKRGDDYQMVDEEAPYSWSYLVGQGEVYIWDKDYTRTNPQQ